MVAIISGNSLGLSLTSLATLGQRGVLGSSTQGRSGEQSFVNVANGNLVLQDFDDKLVGRGLDISVVRTYNSQGLLNDDNGDNWTVGAFGQRVLLTGTVASAGSTLVRTDRDGASATYTWDTARNLYVSNAGAGAFDTISFDSVNARYIWTDGATGLVERYENTGPGRLISVTDPAGNTVSYSYNANGTLQRMADANGETTWFDYSGSNLTQVRTVTTDGAVLTRVRYAYDTANRLSSVTVDLSPEDNSVVDGRTYVTAYTYDGTSKRVASVTQSDGTQLSFTYVQERPVDRISDVPVADNWAPDSNSDPIGIKGRALVGARAGIGDLMTGTQTYDRSGWLAGKLNFTLEQKEVALQHADVGERNLADSIALLKNDPELARQLIDRGFDKISQSMEGARKGTAMLEAVGALRPSNYVELASADWSSAWVLGKTLGIKSGAAPGFTSDPEIFGAFVGALALTGDPSQTAGQLRSLMQMQDDRGLSYFHSGQALEPAAAITGSLGAASFTAGAAAVRSIPGIAAGAINGINAIGNGTSNLVGSVLKPYTTAGRAMTNDAAMNKARVDALVNKAIAKGDPGVPELIVQLEASGVRVKDTNHLVGQPGKFREVDIEIESGMIIQVKKLSSERDIVEQVHKTYETTGQHTVAYVVEQHKKADAIVRAASSKVQVTNKLDTLLEFIKNGHP